jgi:hypothetical protein
MSENVKWCIEVHAGVLRYESATATAISDCLATTSTSNYHIQPLL